MRDSIITADKAANRDILVKQIETVSHSIACYRDVQAKGFTCEVVKKWQFIPAMFWTRNAFETAERFLKDAQEELRVYDFVGPRHINHIMLMLRQG